MLLYPIFTIMLDITTITSTKDVQETLKTEKIGGEIAKIIAQNFLNKPGMTLKDKISM